MAMPKLDDPLDVLVLLKRDHERVRDLLGELGRAATRNGSAAAQTLLEVIRMELRVHWAIEREIFYPAFRVAGRRKDDTELYYKAIEEHRLVDLFLPGLDGYESGTLEFVAKVTVLKDLIHRHFEGEEREMFRRTRKLVARDELVRLGQQVAERKGELTPPIEEAHR